MKKVLSLMMSMMLFVMNFAPVYAKDTFISYEGETAQFMTMESEGVNFENMLPGESRTIDFYLSNGDKETLDFFMSTEILDNIAQKGNQDAIYDFSIAKNEDVFFNTLIGAKGNTIGEEYLVDDNNIKLATLSKGEQCKVSISLKLDGDSTNNEYMNETGLIQLRFSVGTPVVPERKKETVIEKVIKYVNTGDQTPLLVMGSLFIGSALMIIVLAKNKKKDGNQI